MYRLYENTHFILLLLIFLLSLFVLSKASDVLVDNAVKLSELLALPEIIIGATVVSLGTTLPELSASVISALQGIGSFALGNAVGSFITNTSLILGVAALFGSIPIEKSTSQKISVLNLAALLLILPTIPFRLFGEHGKVPQWMGFLLLLLIPVYVYFIIYQEKKNSKNVAENTAERTSGNMLLLLFKITLAAIVIAVGASSLVTSSEILAVRIGVPDIIISSTLVAFGTSVPELSTCISAAKNRHGELAIGNIIGANILNVLFVIGVSAALTNGGINVSDTFYFIHFPAVVIILVFLSIYAYHNQITAIKKKGGILLIVLYAVYLFATFVHSFS